MSDILRNVKQKLSRKTCPTHGKYAQITIQGDRLSFECCCDVFRNKIIKDSEIEMKKAVEESINKMFKGFK